MDKDFIIVGQGLAGTLLAHFLKTAGQRVLVIDAPDRMAATSVAAGIINPVTGRRFVKSWMIETLLLFAKATYQSLENQLGISIYHEKSVLRALSNPGAENDWLARATEPDYAPFLKEKADPGTYQQYLHAPYAWGETTGSAQVDVGMLMLAYRKVLEQDGEFIAEDFDYETLVIDDTQVVYKQWRTKGIIFCEGYGMKANPFFKDLPLRGDKGQALRVRIPGADFEKMYKDQLFIVPMKDDYWIGATYEPRFEQETPTNEGRDFLTRQLTDCLKLPFEVMAHRAAVRPTVKDRRPLLGSHPDFPQVHVFNGLGTKGASLAPYWAQHMTAYLLDKTPIDPQVDIRRFSK